MKKIIQSWVNDLHAAINATDCKINKAPTNYIDGLSRIGTLIENAKHESKTIWWIGNGGSNAICSHMAQDVLNQFKVRSQAITDPALLTCSANDYGYEEVYTHPLKIQAQSGDVLIAISSSGQSANILSCAKFAIENGLALITLSGFLPNNPLWELPAQVSLYVPSESYGLVETAHQAVLHALVDGIALNVKKEDDLSRCCVNNY